MTTSSKRESPSPRAIRRVVTGQDKSGKFIIASDTQVAPIIAPLLPDAALFNFWGADAMPSRPDAGRSRATGPGFRLTAAFASS